MKPCYLHKFQNKLRRLEVVNNTLLMVFYVECKNWRAKWEWDSFQTNLLLSREATQIDRLISEQSYPSCFEPVNTSPVNITNYVLLTFDGC